MQSCLMPQPAMELEKAALDGYTVATDIADAMIAQGVPARSAHALVGAAVARAEAEQRALCADERRAQREHHAEHGHGDAHVRAGRLVLAVTPMAAFLVRFVRHVFDLLGKLVKSAHARRRNGRRLAPHRADEGSG